jgi:dihydropteroate synthase
MLVYALATPTSLDLQQELQQIQCDPTGLKIMQEKRSALTIKITELKGYCAIALKETALSAGAECALPKKTIRAPEDLADVLLLCTPAQLKNITEKCAQQAFAQLQELSKLFPRFLQTQLPALPKLMGILNVTPDSFSDGGKFASTPVAVEHALSLIAQGAAIIDIGGESTRPGAPEITESEELHRVIPVIIALHQKAPQITISIDTTKSAVARAAVASGATMINDISGLTRDPDIARVAAEAGAQLVLMHRLAPSTTMQKDPQYQDILKEILQALSASISLAKEFGVAHNKIIIDPGIGFGKTTEQNLYLIKNLEAFKSLGHPVLLGASRKSFIGQTLDRPVDQRIIGTVITSAWAQRHVDYLRVHDILENRDALILAQAINKAQL